MNHIYVFKSNMNSISKPRTKSTKMVSVFNVAQHQLDKQHLLLHYFVLKNLPWIRFKLIYSSFAHNVPHIIERNKQYLWSCACYICPKRRFPTECMKLELQKKGWRHWVSSEGAAATFRVLSSHLSSSWVSALWPLTVKRNGWIKLKFWCQSSVIGEANQ